VTVEDGVVSTVENRDLDVLRWAEICVDLTDADDMREALERARKSIEKESKVGIGRPIAMRIRFEGVTAISDEIAAFPERLEQQVKALGAEIASENLWIERVENTAAAKRNLESALSEDSAFGNCSRTYWRLRTIQIK